jgi:2-dehydro-3-deoxy-D-arabinonate dehydratase
MKLFRTKRGAVIERDGQRFLLPGADWDFLTDRDGLEGWLHQAIRGAQPVPGSTNIEAELLPPIGTQEVWAAGVTYWRSRDARMDEATKVGGASGGGGTFYDKVYSADRPELFFKASPHRVAGPGQDVRIRADSKWNVPEPELTLVVNSRGKITGYTIGNDMSSRDIEGANPLYLPQAKVYAQSCALGPGVLVTDSPLDPQTKIELTIERAGKPAFTGNATISQMKRTPEELVSWLFRDITFPTGCFLLTGTGVVPPDDFTLQSGDVISIEIAPIGKLVNRVR